MAMGSLVVVVEAALRSYIVRVFFLFFVGLFGIAPLAASAQTGLVISQMYGGGGNSGAPYTYDYLELYNPTSAPIGLNGLSYQYASSSGTSWNSVILPNVSVAPGHYFLIQGAAGSGSPGNLPVTPDFVVTSGPNFSATTGKIALVQGTASLTGSCPTVNVIDFLGYGTANCFQGSGDAPAPSNTTADIRSGFTGNNAADFAVGAPNPHNSSYGGNSSGLSGSGLATPSTVSSGDPVLLTVTVTPSTNPVSTGIAVVADLSAIGGSSAQPFYDDGTHGDATAGDNVFSLSTTATVSKSGGVLLPVTVTDAESDGTTANISLTVNVPVVTLPIHTIQGSKSLTATSVSPYAGQTVTTQGVVTGIGSAGYFIQSRDVDADSDPTTPEGIYVYTGTGKVPATAVVGNFVQVTGSISTYPSVTASHTPATELNSTAATVLATGQPLPTPITITTSMLTPRGGLYQLTPYEGMRVSIPSLTTVSGTDASLSSEVTETEKSNGQFYAVLTGTPRPFREPGIDIRDPQTGLPPRVAKFDDNPERILVDSTFLGSAPLDLSTGALLPNVTGVLDFTYSSDSYYDPSRLVLDPAYNRSAITPGMDMVPAPAPASNEFRVAAYNIERFFNPTSADDIDFNPVTGKTENSSAVDVTPAAYQTRLAKVSLAIRHILGSPDIVALEECENQSVVADIAAQISADAVAAGEPDPQYVAYGTGTSYAPYTNDVGGISVGFLVKPSTVDTLNIQQFGASDLFTDPRDGTTEQTLNDRPPLVLHAGIKRIDATDYPVTVIVNHLRSLSDENDPSSGVFVRTKKELQAEFLAKLIQGYQQAGEHVISVGDYNAFEFSDGYIDILATVTDQNVLPATQVVEPGVAGLVTPPTTDLATLLPADQRWSYQEYGNAQILDHIVATADLVAAGAHMAYAHLDADQPVVAYNDPSTPARTSDHDAAVGYFLLPAPALSATLTGNGNFGSVNVGSTSSGMGFVLNNTGEGEVSISGITASGDFSESNDCGTSLALGATCGINVVFSPSAAGSRSGLLTVTTAAGTYTASLSGTGVPVYDTAISVQYASTHLVYPGATNVTACVAPAGGHTATGTIQIYDGTALLTNQRLQGGGCAYWYISPGLAAGTHSLSATYSGDSHQPGGSSAPTTLTVDPVPVNLSASCWNASFSYGANYQCTVSASSNAGSAKGVIGYQYDGGGTVSVPVSNGDAQFTIPLPSTGSHTISIVYARQGNYAAASAPLQHFTVTPAPANVGLTPSTWYASAGTTFTFQAAVSSWSAGAPKATGSVSFRDGSTLLVTVPVDNNGKASFSDAALSIGSHTITATYANGANYASGSANVTITVAR
ncbi:MAG TPA: Ig-like domain repeat protein [Acidobacteriaceae bacterium]|nr:Ig-like domain repeat protein [Acidobacteriaceae bacterium]